MAMSLSDLLGGGFQGASGAGGDLVRVGGRLYKKTSSGLMDVETGEFAGTPHEANQAVMNMTPEEQMGKVNLPPLPISDADKQGAFRMPPGGMPPQGGGTVNGVPIGAGARPAENYFQRSGGERVTLRPDTGWTTAGGEALVPPPQQPRNEEYQAAFSQNPVDIGVGQKTWRVKGHPNKFIGADGKIFTMERAPTAAEIKADRDWQKDQVEMKYREAQIDELNRKATEQPKLSPTEMKAQKEMEAAAGAKKRVSSVLGELKGYYDNLQDLGGAIDPDQSTLENLVAATGSSWIGQKVGGFVGTPEQSFRDSISQIKPLLIQEIRKATEMGARGMDSEKELAFYLQAATDPSQSLRANMDALERLDAAYGLGLGIVKPKGQQQGQAQSQRQAPPKVGDIRNGYVFRGGNPNDKASWMKAQ